MFAAMSAAYDRVPQTALDEIARTGRAYSNEIRAMARELIALRQQRDVLEFSARMARVEV